MDFYQMEQILAVARTGSISEAARQMCVSQPTMSHAVARAEKEFQTKLFANTRLMLGARSKLDPETKSFIWQTLGSLGGILKNETLKRFKPAPPTWRPLRRETYDPEKGTEA